MIDPQAARLPLLRPRGVANLVTAIVGASFAYDLMRIPVQVSDSLAQLLNVQQSPSLYATFEATARRGAYLRPMLLAQIDVLFDVAQGHYWLAYRGFHALLLIATLLLFIRALNVRTWNDCAAAVFALTVFTGLHTFRGTVREAFPINAFLIIVGFCLLALNLARSRGGWWVDVTAIVTFAMASLTLESGVLVWVVVVVGWACGMRGISSRGVMAVTGCLAAYLWVRFSYYSAGVPGLEERSSGFLLGTLEPEELIERFGANPFWFYLYNVATSILSVPFSEPDGGVFEVVRAWLQGYVPPRVYLAIVSSTVATALICWTTVGRLRKRTLTLHVTDGQLLAIATAVLLGNSAISYAYTKHEILSVAGAFYAVAAFVAARHAIDRWHSSTRRLTRVSMTLVMAAMATMWTARSLGVHHMLRVQAFKVRADWARVPDERMRDSGSAEERRAAALIRQLRKDALDMPVVNPYLLPRWADRWWGE
jgi:hypothetical protein